MKKIRIAGAQIPVWDENIEYNKKEIFKALDWAKENEVDELLTPECALSGYGKYFLETPDKLQLALKEIEDYQKKLGIGLHLGTAIQNIEEIGTFNRNQIRHYGKDGILYGQTNKTYLVQTDQCFVPSVFGSRPANCFSLPNITKPDGDDFVAVGMICNDMWGSEILGGSDDTRPSKSLLKMLLDVKSIDLVLHSTNGFKFDKNISDSSYSFQTFFDWHNINLRHTAYLLSTTLLTVESCVPWNWDGDESIFDNIITPSPSGVVGNHGEWLTDIPRSGRQYFYYDLDIDHRNNALRKIQLQNEEFKKRNLSSKFFV
tara:strand:- start:64 stop:1011 length:948 start_codon:yes stop_codon:yes gene_type:complete